MRIAIVGERIDALARGLGQATGTERAGGVSTQGPGADEDIPSINALDFYDSATLAIRAASAGRTVNTFTVNVVAKVIPAGIVAVSRELDRTGARIAAGTAR